MAEIPDDLNFGVTLKADDASKQRPNRESEANTTSKSEPESQDPLSSEKYDLKKAAHPTACIFTFLFKVAAVVFYLLIGNFMSDILTFITVIILSSIDFWVVKNITGRLLVGLRWWSESGENGEQVWKFESRDDKERKSNIVDKAFFWTSQLGGTLAWGVLLILKVLSFSIFWSLLVLISGGLCATNLYGYYQCRGQHQKKLSELKAKYGQKGLIHFANRIM